MCPFGRLTISKQHPACKCPYKGALYWGAGLGSGKYCSAGGYYHIPGDRPCEVWNFSFVDSSLKGQKKEAERHLIFQEWCCWVHAEALGKNATRSGSVWCLCVCKWIPLPLVTRKWSDIHVVVVRLVFTPVPLRSVDPNGNSLIRVTYYGCRRSFTVVSDVNTGKL